MRTCKLCEKVVPKGRRDYCSKECSKASWKNQSRKKPANSKSLKNERPTGFYVYIWMDGDTPFYVGKGVGRRAWIRHVHRDKTSTYCEKRRANCGDNFRVLIARQRLTEEGAILVESVLINTLRNLGFILYNDTDGSKRLESPPLELS